MLFLLLLLSYYIYCSFDLFRLDARPSIVGATVAAAAVLLVEEVFVLFADSVCTFSGSIASLFSISDITLFASPSFIVAEVFKSVIELYVEESNTSAAISSDAAVSDFVFSFSVEERSLSDILLS